MRVPLAGRPGPIALAAGCLAACAAAGAPGREPLELTDLDLVADDAVAPRHYTLWWHGARIGSAVETERRSPRGTHLERTERVVLRRGDQLSVTQLVIAIDADVALHATSVRVREHDGAILRESRADRAADGRWRIAIPGEAVREAPAEAEPAELLPLRVRRDGGFAGLVLLPGRGFAVAAGRVERIERAAPGRFRATLRTPHGHLDAILTTDRAGDALVVAGADGVVARRATAAEAAQRFTPPEAVAAGALTTTGGPVSDGAPLTLRLAPVDRALPPPLPGQRVVARDGGWVVALDRTLASALPAGRGARALPGAIDTQAVDAIAALARRIAGDITDDLGAAPTGDPRAAIAGDCTVHTLAFAARAADARIDVRVVTGFRLDGDRLVRHRWAVAWTGQSWIAVDPTFGEAPAAARLLGLAVHGTSSAELALADAAFAGLAGATATIEPGATAGLR